MVRLYSQIAFACETLVQPCETLRLPWSPSDHGAAWMYSPPLVVRCVRYTVSRYGSEGSVDTNSSDCCLSMITMAPLELGVFALPRLTGIVLMTSRSEEHT